MKEYCYALKRKKPSSRFRSGQENVTLSLSTAWLSTWNKAGQNKPHQAAEGEGMAGSDGGRLAPKTSRQNSMTDSSIQTVPRIMDPPLKAFGMRRSGPGAVTYAVCTV